MTPEELVDDVCQKVRDLADRRRSLPVAKGLGVWTGLGVPHSLEFVFERYPVGSVQGTFSVFFLGQGRLDSDFIALEHRP